MNKKWILLIVSVLTLIFITVILILTSSTRYNKLVISEKKWNNIISNKNMSTNIKLENIEFNDYNLLIDEENSIIYYSVVDSNKKYNPSIKYTINSGKFKIAFNTKITDEKLNNNDALKLIIYDKDNYRVYSLVATNYPILNINYKEQNNDQKRIPIELELFDNHIDSQNRVLKSLGKLKIIEENNEYSLSLMQESLGHNMRENHMSIFGMEKHNNYTLKLAENVTDEGKYIQLFINNKYVGIYSLEHKDKGGINNSER